MPLKVFIDCSFMFCRPWLQFIRSNYSFQLETWFKCLLASHGVCHCLLHHYAFDPATLQQFISSWKWKQFFQHNHDHQHSQICDSWLDSRTFSVSKKFKGALSRYFCCFSAKPIEKSFFLTFLQAKSIALKFRTNTSINFLQ